MAHSSHSERTSTEPRSRQFHDVILTKVKQINSKIRTYILESQTPIQFRPGQWLDVHIPTLPKPGGFTITSPPSLASRSPAHLSLAIQASPENPAAEWFWRPPASIVGQRLRVRVGGSFFWPPPPLRDEGDGGERIEVVRRVVFVAGGVGINPLMAMLRHLDCETGEMEELEGGVEFLYATKPPEDEGGRMLFLRELLAIQEKWRGKVRIKLFVTGDLEQNEQHRLGELLRDAQNRRVAKDDLREILGGDKRGSTAVYICGPPQMTDEFVEFLTDVMKLPEERVLCEKWW
jgi:NAD(P)H-flavin reductase